MDISSMICYRFYKVRKIQRSTKDFMQNLSHNRQTTKLPGKIVSDIEVIKLTTLVEGDPKAPFSIATTPRCRGWALFHSLDCSTLPLIFTS